MTNDLNMIRLTASPAALDRLTSWEPAQTAPKDQVIIADFGYPWATTAVWSPAQQQWAIAELEYSMFQGAGDPAFVTDYQDASELKGWKPMPAVAVRVPLVAKPTGCKPLEPKA